MHFDGSIPLPIGTKVPQNTVLANPILQIEGHDIEIHDETDAGWPTIATMESDGHPIGVAVDYLGAWHSQEVGIEEVDLILSYEDGEWGWRAIVVFSNKREALERGRYESGGYNGYEFVPWNADDRYEKMDSLLDADVTPIAYTKDHRFNPAHAMQEAQDIETLNRMFGLGDLKTLESRRERLFSRIVPQKVRWAEKDTSLQDLARGIVDQN